jgi:hypothetical protein
LKRAGTRAMNDAGLHPLSAYSRVSGKHPCPWGGGGVEGVSRNAWRDAGADPLCRGKSREGGVSAAALGVRGALFGVARVGNKFVVVDDANISRVRRSRRRPRRMSVIRATVITDRAQRRAIMH